MKARALGLLLLSLSWLGCDRAFSPPTGPNLVLVSIDTLRADRIGAYGYARGTTPRIDALAGSGFVFERGYAPSSNTIISHASLLTSLYPVAHGVRPDVPLDDRLLTLADAMQQAGWETAGFTSHGDWLNEELGFAQGFDHFVSGWGDGVLVNRAVESWLEGRPEPERPFLLFVHYYDVHSDTAMLPYQSPPRFRQRFAAGSVGPFRGCRDGHCGTRLLQEADGGLVPISDEELRWISDLYDGGVAYADHLVGRLLGRLEAEGALDASWIAITADHGEEFREHGHLLHTQGYEETARVPFILRPPLAWEPRRGDGRIGVPVALVDLMPTLLDAAAQAIPADLEGRSLLPLMSGEELPEHPVYFSHIEAPDRVSVRTSEFGLISNPEPATPELYDALADPQQHRDVAARHPDVVHRLGETASTFHAGQLERRSQHAPGPGRTPTPEERARLEALGYVDTAE